MAGNWTITALRPLGDAKRWLFVRVVRRALGSLDDDPVLVVDEHRLVLMEDRDTLPQTRLYALIRFIIWKIQYDSNKYENRKSTLKFKLRMS